MFDGHENHDITLAEAAVLTKRYRDQMQTKEFKGGFFGKDALLQILDQNNCVGIRFYYGLDSNFNQVIVLAGAIANGDDIVNGELKEMSRPCPTYCSSANAINS